MECLVESDSVRDTTDGEKVTALKKYNRYQYGYGGNKMGCEEELSEWWEKTGFPFTALRLPDVMGPYDNLGTHLDVQQRIMQHKPVPSNGKSANVENADTHRISLVYVHDVVAAVMAVLGAGAVVHGEALHIAQAEAPTIVECAPAAGRHAARRQQQVVVHVLCLAIVTDRLPFGGAQISRRLPTR